MDDGKSSHPERGVVIVRSHSRRPVDEVEVKRPESIPGRVVIFCSHVATDAQIIDACMGLLSDGEMALLFEHLGITLNPEEQQP